MIQEKISVSKQIQFLSVQVHLHVHMRTGMCELCSSAISQWYLTFILLPHGHIIPYSY